jgi:hypothetical protein
MTGFIAHFDTGCDYNLRAIITHTSNSFSTTINTKRSLVHCCGSQFSCPNRNVDIKIVFMRNILLGYRNSEDGRGYILNPTIGKVILHDTGNDN